MTSIPGFSDIGNWDWSHTGGDFSLHGLKRMAVRQLVTSGWWPIPHVVRRLPASFDIELTNACNTSCVFCPREKAPRQGFMDLATFKMALHRAKELGMDVEAKSCGLGEPLLHPDLVRFVSLATDEGLSYSITTNGSLLTREASRQLVDAGLKTLFVSASGIGQVYEAIHRLDFASLVRNVLGFMDIADGRCGVAIAVTICDLNEGRVDEALEYWARAGVRHATLCRINSRCGAVDAGLDYVHTNQCREQAVEILRKNRIRSMCWGPFQWYFVGWDGDYYVCSNEYRKARPMGSVHLHNVAELNKRIIRAQLEGIDVCQICEFHPVNKVHELLLSAQRGKAAQPDLNQLVWWLMRCQRNGKLLTGARL